MIIAKTKLPPNFSLFLIIGLFNASRQQEQSIGSQLNSCNYGSIVKLSFGEDLQGWDWLLSGAIKYRINLSQTCEHIFGSSLQQSRSLKSRSPSSSSSVTLAATARPRTWLHRADPAGSAAANTGDLSGLHSCQWHFKATSPWGNWTGQKCIGLGFSSQNKWMRGEVILHVRRLEPAGRLWKLWLWLWSTHWRTTGPSPVLLMWKQTSTGRQSAMWNHSVNERRLNCTSSGPLSHFLLPLSVSLKPFQEWNSNHF